MAAKFRFEWDSRKSTANRHKHGIDFEFARLVFFDPLRKLEIEGDEHGEIRWRTIGEVDGGIYSVTHTLREDEEVEIVRIITARRCSRGERKRYEETT